MKRSHPGFNDVAQELAKQRGISLTAAKSKLASASQLPVRDQAVHQQPALSQPRPPSQEA